MEKRIFISGPSGSGKTTLAKYIAARYQIPFIEGSTKPLWASHGIENHIQLIMRTCEDVKWGLKFQDEVLEYRREKLECVNEFVTDRSPLDNLVYFMLQCAHYVDDSYIEEYREKCMSNYGNDSFVQLVLDCAPNIEDDGFRVNNKHYQMMTEAIFKNLLDKNYLYLNDNPHAILRKIEVWDWESRIDIVDRIFNPNRKEKTIWEAIHEKFGQ